MKYELRKYSFGETIGEAFNLYFDNFLPLLFISLIGNIPSFFYTFYFVNNPNNTMTDSSIAFSLLWVSVLYILTHSLTTGLTIELISSRYIGKSQNLGAYLKNILPLLFPIVGLSILEVLVIGVGFLLLIIPGIILTCGLALSTQILVVERQKVIKSMNRSWSLTKGNKWEIFCFSFVLGLINFGLTFILKLFKNTLLKSLVGGSGQFWVWDNAVTSFFTALITPISVCVFILVYFNLKIEKEGFAVEHLVEQFSIPAQEV